MIGITLTLISGLTACDLLQPQPTSPTTTTEQGGVSATAGSVDGLSLTLNVSSSTIQSGQFISISLDELNPGSVNANIPASQSWALKGLAVGPCGTLNYPVGIAIYQGNYSASNLPTMPLAIFQPGIYACPLILLDITSYQFRPGSDVCDVYSGGGLQPVITGLQVNPSLSVNGYWNGSIFSPFPDGTYTVVGADEWGSFAVIHFQVNGKDTATATDSASCPCSTGG